MKLVFVSVLLAALFGGASLGVAAPKPEKSVSEFNFDEDVLTVDYLKPDLEFVAVVEQEQMKSLIEIRKDFVDEMIKAAEEVY